jgi:hypothetical protein
MGDKSSVRQFLVKLDGIDGYWSALEGGNISSESTKVYDGGEKVPDVITSEPEVEDITITRNFDRERDEDLMAELRQLVGSYSTTLSKTATDPNLVATGKPVVYPKARLKGFNEPTYDAAGTDPAQWGLVFAITQYR